MRRAFNHVGERVALFLHSKGQCEMCGTKLRKGWHADHAIPFSKGGKNEVSNGQALCPECNRRKGANMKVQLRRWQEEALTAWRQKRDKSFLCEACPGSGKTIVGISIIQELLLTNKIDKVIVVVPSKHLKKQWSLAASPFNIQLDYDPRRTENESKEERRLMLIDDFHGLCITYQTVAMNPKMINHITQFNGRKTLIILDEIHHAGSEKSWGKSLWDAFQDAPYIVMFSGTPFREDNDPIPFVTYKIMKQ